MKRVRCIMKYGMAFLVVVFVSSCMRRELSNTLSHIIRFRITDANVSSTLPNVRSVGNDSDSLSKIIPVSGEVGGCALYLHERVSHAAPGNDFPFSTRSSPAMEFPYEDIGVSSLIWKEGKENSTADYYFRKERITKSSNWELEQYRFPDDGSKMIFYGYSPFECTNLQQESGNQTPPSLFYRLPDRVDEQTDVLASVSSEIYGRNGEEVHLKFYHTLTAVNFVVAKDMIPGRITNISIKNVYGEGSHTIGSQIWNVGTSTLNSFSQDVDVRVGHDIQSRVIADFLMIPQHLPDGALIEITYQHALTGKVHNFRSSIAGSEWKMSSRVTYKLSLQSIEVVPVLQVKGYDNSETDLGVPEQSLNSHYFVTSYATVYESGVPPQVVPLPWSTEFSEDNGMSFSDQRPVWLRNFVMKGPGGEQMQKCDLVLFERDIDFDEALRQQSEIKGIYNLSNRSGADKIENTSNCYLVNAPGKYRLPLVYGCGVMNGQENRTSYLPGKPYDNAYHHFKTHNGLDIFSPYIQQNVRNLTDVCLIWQDSEHLIENVDMIEVGGTKFVEFTVSKQNIRQGNAILAVRADDIIQPDGIRGPAIVWSWHIWVTPYVLGTDLVDVEHCEVTRLLGNDKAPEFFPIPLGFCAGPDSRYFIPRSMQVRFSQDLSLLSERVHKDAVKTMKFEVPVKMIYGSQGNAPYYQWGRKDPMCPALGNKDQKPLFYQYPNIYFWHKEESNKDVNYGLFGDAGLLTRFPHLFLNFTVSGGGLIGASWTKGTEMNLWNVDLSGYNGDFNQVYYPTKSIYDPSPVGFCVMQNGCFNGRTYGTTSINEVFKFMGGYLDRQGECYEFGESRYYWMSEASQNYSAPCVYMYGGFPGSWAKGSWGQYKGYGFNVQPVKLK